MPKLSVPSAPKISSPSTSKLILRKKKNSGAEPTEDLSVNSGASKSSTAFGSRFSKGKKIVCTDAASVVSELPNDDSAVKVSKKASLRSTFSRGKKRESTDDGSIVSGLNADLSVTSGASKLSIGSFRSKLKIPSRGKKKHLLSDDVSALSDDQSVGSVGINHTIQSSSSISNAADRDRLAKDAKSRFNLGLIYLKTSEFTKAQDNLEHALYCYLQLHGHDERQYTNDILFAVAGVREKLGECCFENPDSTDKGIGMDHYEESRRLLRSVAAGDAPDNIKNLLESVDEKIQSLILSGIECRSAPSQAKRQLIVSGDGESVVGGASVAGANMTTEVAKASKRSQFKSKLAGKLKRSKKFDLNPFNDDELDPEHDLLLSDIASELLRNVEMKDHTHGMTTYHACFVGSKAVDFMVESEVATSRMEAVKIGREIKKAGYIEHVVGVDDFEDDVLFYHFKDPVISKEFAEATAQLEHNNHSTAANILTAVRDGGSLMNVDFRSQWVLCMMQVANSALQGNKVNLATDVYEAVYSALKKYEDTGADLKLAVKGCIKGHKLCAIEAESTRECASAIDHRTRMYELLIDDYRTLPACRQLLKIAYLCGEEHDFSRAASKLADAIQRLSSGVTCLDVDAPDVVSREALRQFVHSCGMAELDDKELETLYGSIDIDGNGELSLEEVMCYFHSLQGVNKEDFGKMVAKFLKGPKDRVELLIHCYTMRAVCCSKMMKWMEASEQYSELLPLLKEAKGTDSREYNSALIQKAALSVALKNYHLAHDEISQYLDFEKHLTGANGNLIVDDSDYVLALDTAALTYLKLGNTDTALQIYKTKLAFVKTLCNNDEMQGETMHKLGCLLAYKNQPIAALPLLNEALNVRRRLYDGTSKSVLESTWAVAATYQILGDENKSLKEYSALLDKIGDFDQSFTVLIHKSAGKLFAEERKTDKAVHCFCQALLSAETPEMKTEISLNLANALSSTEDLSKAMEIYDRILDTNSGQQTKLHFLALFDKSLLLIKMGKLANAKEILDKIAGTESALADDVRVGTYFASGNLAITEGKLDDALNCFKKALVVVQDGDVESVVQAKKNIGLTYFAKGMIAPAIASFESALEALSDKEGKSVNLLKADVWNQMTQVYKQVGDLPQAKNYAELALLTCKSEMGETHPRTLRYVSNFQLLLLEEAEGLPPKESKPIIEAARLAFEELLEYLNALDDPWTYRVDVASLNTNLALISIWLGKPKAAKKHLRKIKEIELPPNHSLVEQMALIQSRIDGWEKKKK